MSVDVSLSEDHPLALELASLSEAVSYYQGETHRATVQLQHRSLEHATILQHLHTLENENSHLRAEIQVHHTAGPSAASHRDTLQIQELTLALRRLSDKLDLNEKVLLERNEELLSVQSCLSVAMKAEEDAVEAANRLRTELETSRARDRELLGRIKASEEQRKMSDLVLEEYASLVRSLEGRPSRATQPGADVRAPPRGSLDGLLHARQGLHKLLQDSNSDSEKLHAEIGHLHDALDSARSELKAEMAAAMEDRRRLAQVQLEIHKLKCDDNAAAKMVSRYMKFSQSSTDVLHAAIENLKARQEAIITSYEARLRQCDARIASEMRQSEILRRALDELTEDISRESYGRRREVTLRLTLLEKEEIRSERLRRWLLRSHEALRRASSMQEEGFIKEAFERILNDAGNILSNIDKVPVSEGELSSSAARVWAAQAAVKALQVELQWETDRRLYFEYQLAISQRHGSEPSVVTPNLVGAGLCRPSNSIVSVVPASASGTAESSGNLFLSRPNAETSRDTGCSACVNFSSSSLSGASTSPNAYPTPSFNTSSPEPSTSVTTIDSNVEHDDEHASHGNTSLPEFVGETGSVSPDNVASSTVGLGMSHLADESGVDHLGASTEGRASEPEVKEQDTFVSTQTETNVLSDLEDNSAVCGLQTSVSERRSQTEPQLSHTRRPEQSPTSVLPEMTQDEHYKPPCDLPPLLEEKGEGSDSGLTDLHPERSCENFASVLSKLDDVNERYVNLQHSFRDCHLSLQELMRIPSNASGLTKTLDVIIERLSDYCEDARVELEIRIADEERIAKGYQVLLSVPGALSDEVNEQEIVRHIEAFLDGSDLSVRRMQDVLRRKLDDLQHDIASVKRVMHNTSSPILSPQDFPQGHGEQLRAGTSSWASWAGTILTPSRTSSPTPSFGAVMTSPRLRHSSSSRSLRADKSSAHNSLSNLDLRIPMPSLVQSQSETASPPSPMIQRGGPRPRIMPNVFSLGLRGGLTQGMQRSSLAFHHNVVSSPGPGKNVGGLDNDIE